MPPTPAAPRFGLIVASLALLLIHGEPLRADVELRLLVPELDRDAAAHLVYDDDRALAAYGSALGQHRLREAYEQINLRLWNAPRERYVDLLRVLGPHHGRLAHLIASTGFASTGWEHEYRMKLGAQGAELNRVVIGEFHVIQADKVLLPAAKIDTLWKLRHQFERIGYERGLIAADALMGKEYARIKRPDARMQLLHRALQRSRELGDIVMVCQLLGELSYEHTAAGKLDSTLQCLQELSAIADRFELASQAVRARGFLARHHQRRGQFVIAAEMYEDAQRVARRMKNPSQEIRTLYESMDLYARMGCWDMVRRQSRRVPPLLRSYERQSPDYEWLELKALLWEARIAFASGRRIEAIQALIALRAPFRRIGLEDYALITADYARRLLEVDSLAAAYAVADQGVAFADSNALVHFGAELSELRARAAIRMHDHRAGSALADARRRADERPGTPALTRGTHDLLEVELALTDGTLEAASRRFGVAYAAFRDSVRSMQGGPHSQLVVAEAADFHALGHRLLADRSEAGMRFELDWRSLPGTMGRGASLNDVNERSPLDDELRHAIHLVYAFTPAGLYRWTKVDGRVHRDHLAPPAGGWDARIDRTLVLLTHDPGAKVELPDSLRALLIGLGRRLLPDVARDHPGRPVLVTADGSLARLPFEALHAGTGSAYEPLLARSPVLYARPVRARARNHGVGTAILAGAGPGGPTVSDVERHVSLPAVEQEARDAARRLPAASIQRSEVAARPEVLDAWQKSSIVYVASHLVRDPDAPLLAHFPLSRGRSDRRDDAVIDLRDVAAADLTRCDLAVLSSCASGEPYVVSGRSGPSMADAMIDGGAAAAFHTRWRVRDDRAAAIAPELAETWVRSQGDRVRALWRLRQSALRSDAGWRHPFEWAAWSTTVRWPVPQWNAVAPQGPGRWMAARARAASGEPGAARTTASK